MSLRIFFFLFIMALSSWAQAFELIMIQSVSDTKKTFITRNGKRQGITQGMTGTFTAEDVSILAKASHVTGNFTQWQVINPEALLPFEKGTLVTYYPATEYLWAISQESERRKYIMSEIGTPRQSWVFKGALTRGLTESVSETKATTTRRGGFLGEAYYERDFFYGFSWDAGMRYERESVAYSGATYLTRRSMFVADLIYYFNQFQDTFGGRIYVAAGMGYGVSNTSATGLSQTGQVALLPSIKAGLTLPFSDEWEFLLDAAFESLQTSEVRENDTRQTTTQTNLKTGFGIRRFF